MNTDKQIKESRNEGDGMLSLGRNKTYWTIDNLLSLLKISSHTADSIYDSEINNAQPPRTVEAIQYVLNKINKCVNIINRHNKDKFVPMTTDDAVIAWCEYMKQHPDFIWGQNNVEQKDLTAINNIESTIYSPLMWDSGKLINPKNDKIVERINTWKQIKQHYINRYNSLKKETTSQNESIKISKQQLINIITESVIKKLKKSAKKHNI